MQIHNAIITGSFSYNGEDLSNVTSSNAYSASLSSRTTDLESTSSVLVGASSSFSSILSSVSSSQQQISSSFLTLTASFNAVSASQQQISSSILTLTASYTALSSSYTSLSASYNTFSGSASTRITVDSASLLQVSASQQQISSSLLNVISIFATTGSNSFRATQSITGSLTVTGQIIAQTLNVQQVTSSIIYSSGSNNFGCDLNSRQTFTGSVNITGSTTLNGALTGTSGTFSSYGYFNSANGQYAAASRGLVEVDGAASSVFGLTVGNVAKAYLYTTAIETALKGYGNLILQAGNYNALTFTGSTGAATFISSATATQFNVSASGGTTQIYNTGGGHTVITNATANKDINYQTSGTGVHYFNTAGVDRLTIASTGIACFACQVCAPNLLISNCINIGTTVSLGSRLSIESPNDQAGITMYNSYDCNKWSLRTGTVGVSNKGFAIVDDICNATRIQINGAGNVGIGTSVPDAKLHICNAVAGGTNNYLIIVQNACTVADARAGIAFSNNSQTPSAGGLSGASIQTSNNGIDGAGNLLFSTLISGTNCERMRITSAGDVAINDTTANTYAKLQVTATSGATLALANPSAAAASVGSSIWFYGTTGYNTQGVIQTGYDGTSNVYAYMAFSTRGGSTTERMRITSAGITCFGFTVCAPCFATISDYRMKSNVRPIEGLSIIMKTKPYKFEYNYDCSTSFGMIAHELQDTLPEAVFGQKDGEVMQGVDYMKLLPITIKAIQEQQCTICSQASMINQLKTCLGIN